MLLQFCLESLEQRERIRCPACESGQNAVMVEASHFACGGFDDDIAQRDLAVATQSNGGAAASGQNGSAVVSVHGDAEVGSGTPGMRV